MLYACVILCIIVPHTSYFHAGPVLCWPRILLPHDLPCRPVFLSHTLHTSALPPRYPRILLLHTLHTSMLPRILLLHTLHTSVLPRILVSHTSHLRATPAFLSHTYMVYISMRNKKCLGQYLPCQLPISLSYHFGVLQHGSTYRQCVPQHCNLCCLGKPSLLIVESSHPMKQ